MYNNLFGVGYQFTFAGVLPLDVTVDPVSGRTLGPPKVIEIIGGGTFAFRCDSDLANRAFTGLVGGESYEGLSIQTVQQDACTVTGIRVLW